MRIPIFILLLPILALFACQQKKDEDFNELLKFNTETINRQNEIDIRFLNLINSKTKYLLSIENPDSISSDSLNAIFKDRDTTFFNQAISKLKILKEKYNASINSQNYGIQKNYLALFKRELIHFTLTSMEYCSPTPPEYNYPKVFSEITTLNPTKGKSVDVVLSLGLFDTMLVKTIYIGGYDTTGLNARLITDTIFTEKGFGRYSFVPTKSGINTIKGVFEIKTKRQPKYTPLEVNVLITD